MAHHFGPRQADPLFGLSHHVKARQKTRSLVGPMSLGTDFSYVALPQARLNGNGNGPPLLKNSLRYAERPSRFCNVAV